MGGIGEQRIIQTGVEYERGIRRQDVVVGAQAGRYIGRYEAPVVAVGNRGGLLAGMGDVGLGGSVRVGESVRVVNSQIIPYSGRFVEGVPGTSRIIGGNLLGSGRILAGDSTFRGGYVAGSGIIRGGGDTVTGGGGLVEGPSRLSSLGVVDGGRVLTSSTLVTTPPPTASIPLSGGGFVTGVDRNRDGIPDVVQRGQLIR